MVGWKRGNKQVRNNVKGCKKSFLAVAGRQGHFLAADYAGTDVHANPGRGKRGDFVLKNFMGAGYE